MTPPVVNDDLKVQPALADAARRLQRGLSAPPEQKTRRRRPKTYGSSLADAMLSDFFPDQGFEADSWRSWRTIFKVLRAEPLDAGEREFLRAWTGRTSSPSDSPEEFWGLCGRGSGKTTAGALLAAWTVKLLAEWARTRPS